MSRHFQQTDFWCDFKCAHGWKKFTAADGTNILVRQFKKFFFDFSLAYVPMAPEVKNSPPEEYFRELEEFSQNVSEILPSNTAFIRFDVPYDFDTVEECKEFTGKAESQRKIKKSAVDVQPPDTTFIDLAKSEAEILASMKPKWRYNIRYAEKHGVLVRKVRFNDENFENSLESFYNLYKITAKRDGIGIHPYSYYRDLFKLSAENKENPHGEKTDAVLYIASHENKDLAAIIVLFTKDETVYLYGCSGNEKRNLMPSYLVQWNAICDAKKFDSKIYDFYGIPPADDKNHPMHGLYLFKSGFGGKIIHRPGCFDLPLGKFYAVYSPAERLRAFWHKKIMKKIRGR